MQREVITKAKTLKLKNPFVKELVQVENNRATLRVDEFYADENNNIYYVFAGNGVFSSFDDYANTPLSLNKIDFCKINKELLNPNSKYLLLFNSEIDDKYKKDLEEFLLERIKNGR